jgi:hypothetical protein
MASVMSVLLLVRRTNASSIDRAMKPVFVRHGVIRAPSGPAKL